MSSRKSRHRVPPLALGLAAALAQRGLSHGPGRVGYRRKVVAGAAGLASTGLLAASVTRFRSRRTTVDPRAGAVPAALVTDGVNAFTRNPMYLGMAGLLLAHALWSGRAAALVPAAAFVAWVDRVQIAAEEDDLRESFAGAFDEYAARVPRWLGSTPRATAPAVRRRSRGRQRPAPAV